MQKEKFLRSKGLSDAEVQMAFQQAGIFAKDPNNTIINMDIMHQTPSILPLHRVEPETALQKIYHVISSTAIMAGVVYSIYYVYKVSISAESPHRMTNFSHEHIRNSTTSNTSNHCYSDAKKTTER